MKMKQRRSKIARAEIGCSNIVSRPITTPEEIDDWLSGNNMYKPLWFIRRKKAHRFRQRHK